MDESNIVIRTDHPKTLFRAEQRYDDDSVAVHVPDFAQVADGEVVQVGHLEQYGYVIVGRITEIGNGAGRIRPENIIERREAPFPAPVAGELRLPNRRHHCHYRDWVKGDVITLFGQYWLISKMKQTSDEHWRVFSLKPSTLEAFGNRWIRVEGVATSLEACNQNLQGVLDTLHGPIIVSEIDIHDLIGGATLNVRYTAKGKLLTRKQVSHTVRKRKSDFGEILRKTYLGRPQIAQLPEKCILVWERRFTRRTENWYEGADGVIYFERRSAERAQLWATTATKQQIETAKIIGLQHRMLDREASTD